MLKERLILLFVVFVPVHILVTFTLAKLTWRFLRSGRRPQKYFQRAMRVLDHIDRVLITASTFTYAFALPMIMRTRFGCYISSQRVIIFAVAVCVVVAVWDFVLWKKSHK